MAVDARYGNSSGYFKDPITEEDLSPDTPRVVSCSLENGKFTWPMVMCSNGEQMLKIVYKYFTDEEKELYKQYRGRSTGSSTPRAHKLKEPKSSPQESEPVQVVKYSEESAVSVKTLLELAQCDILYGISQIAGISYILCGAHGSNVVHHIPRACVPDEEFERLCGGA